jgi:hypothetical protein
MIFRKNFLRVSVMCRKHECRDGQGLAESGRLRYR